MRITCFITVCACLLSTVSTDEIKHSNRIRKIRSRDELAVKDIPPAINPVPELPLHLLSILRGSRTPIRIETFPKSKKTREFQSSAQQKQSQPQHRHYNRARPKRLMKRLKVRSIHGASLELGDNHLTELGPDSIHSSEHHTIHEHESIHEHDSIHEYEPIHVHDEDSIHIEPVLRVTKKHNVLDSILDILRQLLHPSKNEPGPLVGPIKIPGSGRKIYLRLIEPVDASQVMVRFITQVPVPTADAEHKPVFHIPPVLHPADVLLHYAHGQGHEHHIGSSELHSESSHRYRVVHSPRNYSRAPNKERHPQLHGKPTVLSPSKSPTKDSPADVSNTSTKEPSRNMEPSKTELASTQVKPTTQQQETSFKPADSYYQYASAEKIVQDLLNITSGSNDSSAKTPGEPWYQLNTYRLPLRQIAPLYPFSSMEHTGSTDSSYEDTYKVPSDVLTGPSSYSSSSYEHYNTANSASGFTAGSYEQQPYDPHYSSPSSYATSYNNNKLSNVPSAFSTPYRQQNEPNGVPNPYSTSYRTQNQLGNTPNSYSSETLNDLLSAPSSYSGSYERGTVPPSLSSYDSSFEKQNGVRAISSGPHVASYEKENDDQFTAISHDALRVINPPYLSHSQQPLGNQDTNRSVERQPRYNPQNINEMISSIGQNAGSSIEHVIWGETKQQKSDLSTSFQKNSSPELEDSDETWQPLVFVHENADWHEFADLIRGAESGGHQKSTRQQQHRPQQQQQQQQLLQRQQRKQTDWPRKSSTSERDRRRNQRQNKPTTTQNPKCLSENENNGCKPTKTVATSTPRSEKTKSIVEEQQTTRTVVDPMSELASNAIEMVALKLDISAEIPTTSTTSSVTEKPLPLIKTTTSTTTTTTPAASSITEKSLPSIRTTKNPIASGKLKLIVKNDIKEVSSTSDTTKESLTENTTPSNTTKKLVLPKRPMIMKKPTLIIKRLGLNNKTQKPTTDSATTDGTTTKRTLTTRKSKFRSAIARTKSSTT